MNSRCWVFGVAVCLFACGGPEVRGKVVMAGIDDASGIEVDALLGTTHVASTQTAKDGSWSISGLKSATYTVEIKAPSTTEKILSFPVEAKLGSTATTTTLHGVGIVQLTVVDPFRCTGGNYLDPTQTTVSGKPTAESDSTVVLVGPQTVTYADNTQTLQTWPIKVAYNKTLAVTLTVAGGSQTLSGHVALPGLPLILGCGQQTTSDANGDFTFGGLPDNTSSYVVSIVADSYLEPDCTLSHTMHSTTCRPGGSCSLQTPETYGDVTGRVTIHGASVSPDLGQIGARLEDVCYGPKLELVDGGYLAHLPTGTQTLSYRYVDGGQTSATVDVAWHQTTEHDIELAP